MVARILRHARANAVAYAALFVALGGTSYAAIKLPANSVGTKQIKKAAVTRAKLKANAVDSSRVANGSLLAGDFKAGQLPAGPAGPQGPKGEPGAKGDPGDPAQLANGSVGPSKFAVLPRARVNNYADPQAIPNDTETPIDFTAEEEDTDGMVDLTGDNSTVTIKTPGVYLLNASFSWAANNTGRRSGGFKINNGSDYRGLVSQQAVQNDDTWQETTRVERFVAGDTIQLFVYQNSGATRNTSNYDGIAPQMTVQWLSP